MYDADDVDQGPRGTYEIYRAEGDSLYINGNYGKAINSYSTALELRPGEKECLVSRSRCHLLLGAINCALRDAEACLADQPTFHKGLYQKAEALYFKGEFELALMFYHRGHRIRPELQEFRLGIQKAREAIHNSVGSPERVRLTTDGDLTYFEKLAIGEAKPSKKRTGPDRRCMLAARSSHAAKQPVATRDDPSIKQLLGELYGDRVYLEKLLKEPISNSGKSPIYGLVKDGLHYLDSRTEFWRQQKSSRPPVRPTKRGKNLLHVRAEIDDIEQLQVDDRFEGSVRKARHLMASASTWGTDVPREEIMAELHGLLGVGLMLQDKNQSALEQFNLELRLVEELPDRNCRARAHTHLGRVHISRGQMYAAASSWTAAIECSNQSGQLSWMQHELGRCLLEVGRLSEAAQHAVIALQYAEQTADLLWQLNAHVLIGQCRMKQHKYAQALETFYTALKLANIQNDSPAHDAIQKAIENVDMRLVEEQEKEQDKEREGELKDKLDDKKEDA